MSVKKFKFVSPGVFVNEIDNSQVPAVDAPAGPTIIGRLPRGPGMKPVKINSFSEYIQVFGDPVPGHKTGDVWREGNYQGPTYGAYAAQAYLAANVGAINVVRLLGYKHEDATAAGEAGWQTTAEPSADYSDNGGAYGLFVFPSASAIAPSSGELTGRLAAIWYMDSGSSVLLSGSRAGTTLADGGAFASHVSGTGVMICSVSGTDPYEFVVQINDAAQMVHKTSFNLDQSSPKFIRNVFNTNPQNVNSAVVPSSGFSQGENLYWLGETFSAAALDNAPGANAFAMIMPLEGKAENRMDAREAHSGWVFSQDLTDVHTTYDALEMQKLFRIHAIDAGNWASENMKVSIQDLSYSRNTTGVDPFGSFTVVVRKADDTDNVVQVIEKFSNCNLNPLSENYVAKKIGTRYMTWDSSNRVLKTVGQFNNQSNFIRIEMAEEVENSAIDPKLLPFGVRGAPKYGTAVCPSGSVPIASSIIKSGSAGAYAVLDGGDAWNGGRYLTGSAAVCRMEFPSAATRISASAGGLSNAKDAYFGLNVSSYAEIDDASAVTNVPDPGYGDYVFALDEDFGTSDEASSNAKLEYQWVVSLDDVRSDGGSVYWQSGSRKAGTSITAEGANTWRTIIDNGYTQFTSPLFNGFDGLDIVEIEPFRNTKLDDGTGPMDNYAANSVRRAIDTVADPEFVEMNLLTMPGLTNASLTDHMIQVCEDRGDSLALIDIPDVYTPFTEGTSEYSSFTDRLGSVSSAVSNLENRQINSSYACTYYPWVQVRDTISGPLLWVPPSVVALGTFASSEAKSELWFAPAGFNRGGLSEGSAGLPVLAVTERVISKDRDTLYEANINPIASFPNEGIVIFGQKTLQITPSALDRINVRRMMIFVKKQVSTAANTILFDQNVEVTWNRFKSRIDPILRGVQNRLGISEYKLILDSSTTTPDLVDRNIVYAKIFIKPAKAIEYIAIDFVLTDSGAAFGD